jgi:hypothetical protein
MLNILAVIINSFVAGMCFKEGGLSSGWTILNILFAGLNATSVFIHYK